MEAVHVPPERAPAAPVEVAGIADPAPLGLAAFALTTFVLSMFNADLIGKGGEPVVLAVALAYGGLTQLLAGMWEFKRGNTFGAVAFSSFGAFWLSFWALNVFYAKSIPAGDVGDAVGLFLIGWGIFTTAWCSCSCCWRSRSSCSGSATPAPTPISSSGAGTSGWRRRRWPGTSPSRVCCPRRSAA
jgi:succinate-acetate transporter protein